MMKYSRIRFVCALVVVLISEITVVNAYQYSENQSKTTENDPIRHNHLQRRLQRQEGNEQQNRLLVEREMQMMSPIHSNANAKPIRGSDFLHQMIPPGAALLTPKQIKEIHQEKNDLTVVIHIGPMKTGSSSIQTSFVSVLGNPDVADGYEDSGLALEEDLHTYNLIGCFRDPNANKDEFIICNPNTLPQIHQVAARRHNLVLSAEYLTSPDTNIALLKEFLRPWKHQRVVAYYRRYYDWLQSFHNQGNKKLSTDKRQPLTEFLAKEMRDKFWWDKMYIIESLNRWGEYFDEFRVMNIYELPDGDVRDSFYCKALPNATSACNKFRAKKAAAAASTTPKPKVNPSVAFVYEDLAFYALEMGLWSYDSTGLTIRDASKKAKTYQENELQLTKYDFGDALICPDEATSTYLLQASIDTEQKLFPEYFAEQGENELRSDFATLKRTSLCHVDAKVVLQENQHWRQFFETL